MWIHNLSASDASGRGLRGDESVIDPEATLGPGEDRRDATTLARLHRAGELSPIYVPNESDEEMRGLVRGRKDAVGVTRKAKQRRKAFVLRHGLRYHGRSGWTIPYRRWLAGLTMPEPVLQVALQKY